jgi:predicted permease
LQGEILIYAGVVIAVFNLLTWSVGVFIVSGDRKQISVKKAILNPTVIALIIGILVFVIAKVPLKDIVSIEEKFNVGDHILESLMKSCNFLAEMVTPVSMTVIGIKLANSNLKKILLDKWAYVNALNKLIVMSLISILVTAFLPIEPVMKYCVFFLLSMPSATNTVMFAVRFGGDSDSGTVFVLLSTMLSCVTLPLIKSR